MIFLLHFVLKRKSAIIKAPIQHPPIQLNTSTNLENGYSVINETLKNAVEKHVHRFTLSPEKKKRYEYLSSTPIFIVRNQIEQAS